MMGKLRLLLQYLTYDQLNEALPSEKISSEQIENVMSLLSQMGINVVDDDDQYSPFECI